MYHILLLMELVPEELILEICIFVKVDRNKIFFLSTCTKYHPLKSKTRFNTLMRINKIMDLFYYDMFTNITINSIEKLPLCATRIRFESSFIGSVKDRIPPTVKSLHFVHPDNEKFRKDIPTTVKCATFQLTHYQQFLKEQHSIMKNKNIGLGQLEIMEILIEEWKNSPKNPENDMEHNCFC